MDTLKHLHRSEFLSYSLTESRFTNLGLSDYKYKTTNSMSSKRERNEITQGLDQSWTFEEAIERSNGHETYVCSRHKREGVLLRYKLSIAWKNNRYHHK
jgi:hypothetical protein